MNIRIVNSRGRYALFHVLLDDSGHVEQLYDEVETSCHDYHAMLDMIDAIAEAKKHSVVMLNSSNRKELIREE